jgi:hypothetical protein
MKALASPLIPGISFHIQSSSVVSRWTLIFLEDVADFDLYDFSGFSSRWNLVSDIKGGTQTEGV